MREAEIRAMHQATANRSMMTLRQLEFVETRNEAIEEVIKGSTFLQRVGMLISVSSFLKRVDAVHLALYQKCQERMAAAAEASKDSQKKKSLIHRVGR